MSQRRGGEGRAAAVALAGLFVAAISLRPQIIGVGPLLPAIKSDLGISHAVQGLLSTIPVLCMGVFSPVAVVLARRFGARVAIAVSIAAIAAGGLVRVATPHAALLLLFTVPVGIGTAVAGTLMPVVVKQRFSHRPGLATGVYATGIQVGSTAAAGLAVPLAHAHGGWRFSLAVFSGATALLVPAWLLGSRGSAPLVAVSRPKLPLRSATAWRLVVVFALVSFNFYGISHWLADSYVERGWSEARAGWLLTAFQAATVPAGLFIPLLADRAGSRRLYLFFSAALLGGSMLGVILAHGGGFVWAVLAGVGNGVLFPIAMTLPLDVSDDPAEAGAAAAMMLGVGYSLISVSPFLLGAIRDATGSFTDSLWVVFGVAAALTLVSSTITHERLHRGVGSR